MEWLTKKIGKRDNLEQSVALVKLLATEPPMTLTEIMTRLNINKDPLNKRIRFLRKQNFVVLVDGRYRTTEPFTEFYRRFKKQGGK